MSCGNGDRFIDLPDGLGVLGATCGGGASTCGLAASMGSIDDRIFGRDSDVFKGRARHAVARREGGCGGLQRRRRRHWCCGEARLYQLYDRRSAVRIWCSYAALVSLSDDRGL